MEMLILAGVGLAGYGLSGVGKRRVVNSVPYMSHVDPLSLTQPDNAVRNARVTAANKAMYDADFKASRNPCGTGVIPPNQREVFDMSNQPFYRSNKTQATSDAYKQDKLELFSGQLDSCRSQTGTYQSKRETGPMFPATLNAQPVTSSGRQAYVDLRGAQDEERYQVGLKHHGSGPVDRLRVGPGLGLAPDVPAAGGFQQFFRICPENVNVHRKNNLPGRINPGSASVQGGANVGIVNHKAQKPIWSFDRMPLTAGRATLTGPAAHGEQPTSCRTDATEGFMGHAFGGVLAPSSTMGINRGRTDDRFGGTVLNAAGQTVQTGGYQGQHIMDPGAFRNPLGMLPTGGVTGAEQGGFQTTGVQVAPTQREQPGFQPNIGNMQTGQSIRNQQATRAVTGRETLDQRHFMTGGVSGPNAPALTLDAGINKDKPDTCVGYMPLGVTQNMWNPNTTTARLKNPQNATHVNQGGMTSVNYGRYGDNQRCQNKLPITNNLDLSLAKDILNQNPLTHRIFA